MKVIMLVEMEIDAETMQDAYDKSFAMQDLVEGIPEMREIEVVRTCVLPEPKKVVKRPKETIMTFEVDNDE